MGQISIGYFADGPWSHKAFDMIIRDDSIDVKFIVPRKDTTDLTLKKFSEEYEIEYLFPANINSPEFISKVKEYNCDLFVSMSFNQIFRKEILGIPKLGTINCHAGKLPFYRGRNILNWALINDEKEFGITVHYIDEGIDTGDIIKQGTYPITDQDDYSTLLEVAHVECANILYESLKLIQTEKSSRIEQSTIHPVGFYCGTRGVGDEIIDWNYTSRELFNFIRAIAIPGPMATTYFKNEIVRINKSKMINDATEYKGTEGQLLAKTPNGFLVKTRDSFIEIFQIDSGTTKLKVGDKLNNK